MVVPPPTAARTGGPAVTPGTTTRRCRAGAGERADSANQIPGGIGGFSDPGAANGSG